MSKKRNMDMQLMMCLSFLLVECLDRLNVVNPSMIKYKEDLTKFIEHMGNEVSDTNVIQRSTYFQDLQNKILTVIRRSFQDL